eukprot:355908-Chlamydomonas_euryale.AAC.15
MSLFRLMFLSVACPAVCNHGTHASIGMARLQPSQPTSSLHACMPADTHGWHADTCTTRHSLYRPAGTAAGYAAAGELPGRRSAAATASPTRALTAAPAPALERRRRAASRPTSSRWQWNKAAEGTWQEDSAVALCTAAAAPNSLDVSATGRPAASLLMSVVVLQTFYVAHRQGASYMRTDARAVPLVRSSRSGPWGGGGGADGRRGEASAPRAAGRRLRERRTPSNRASILLPRRATSRPATGREPRARQGTVLGKAEGRAYTAAVPQDGETQTGVGSDGTQPEVQEDSLRIRGGVRRSAPRRDPPSAAPPARPIVETQRHVAVVAGARGAAQHACSGTRQLLLPHDCGMLLCD